MKRSVIPHQRPICVNPQTAAEMIGIGRTMLYALMNSGEVSFLKIGKRTLIRVEELERWLKSKEDAA